MLLDINTKKRIHNYELKKLHPNISFPINLAKADLSKFGYAKLHIPKKPLISKEEILVDVGEELIDGKWYIKYEVKKRNLKNLPESIKKNDKLFKLIKAGIEKRKLNSAFETLND